MNSQLSDTSDALPPSPEGYAAPVQFRYPMGMLQVASLIALIVSGLIFVRIATTMQGLPFGEWFSLDIFEILLVLLMLPATIVLHELIHGVVFQLLGYRVYYGFAPEMGAAYAAAFGQWQKRIHNAIAAAAPLIVITLIFVPMLSIPGILSRVAFVVLLINTSGAVGDVYILYRLARMPRRTLLYDISIDTMLMYFPADSAAHASPVHHPEGHRQMLFILASSSPRRQEMIASLGIDFEIIKPEIDETQHEGEDPLAYVQRLSAEKAAVVARQIIARQIVAQQIVAQQIVAQQPAVRQLDQPTRVMILAADTIVLAADTIGITGDQPGGQPGGQRGEILGKPADDAESRAMLQRLRQHPHDVYTAFRLLKLTQDQASGEMHTDFYDDLVRTRVTMRPYTDTEIDAYAASGDPFDKAGGYAIQNAAFHPVQSIDGCYNNVVGLPLCAVKRGLAALGWPGMVPPADCDCPRYLPPEA